MKIFHSITSCAAALATAAAVSFTGMAVAQEFPSKPIHIINAFAPGGATDTAIRGLTKNSDAFIDQPIVIDSVTGGGGVAGILQAAQAEPDGYTLLVADTVLTTLALFQENLPVSADDFRPIGVFNLRGAWFLTRPSKNWKTLDEFVAAAKEKPGELTVGVPALSSPQHLAIIAIEDTYGIDVNIIPYGGGAPTMAALLGDQIDAAMPGVPAGLDSINTGDAVFLVASTDLELVKFKGDLTSFADVGIPHDLGIWTAVWAPKDTPDDVMVRLSEIFGGMAQSSEWIDFAKSYGVTPIWKPLDDAAAYIASSSKSMSDLAKLIK
uniref:tripartite tricarboxylate transporter substrate binding protein n=1 Tax=Pararhizobium sp. IMCC3301 TaxID=3067904 RepID=UPI002740F203|nr:tripartite tricarboxylate transporter substrate binding protein [Pararhizobium sp. IMCC3301]